MKLSAIIDQARALDAPLNLVVSGRDGRHYLHAEMGGARGASVMLGYARSRSTVNRWRKRAPRDEIRKWLAAYYLDEERRGPYWPWHEAVLRSWRDVPTVRPYWMSEGGSW